MEYGIGIARLRRQGRLGLVAAACAVGLVLVPSLVSAQAIAGTVVDSTGSVLAGVTVEARSPALIEQVRVAVTDGTGQYRIIALETGVYSVTFTLSGFSTFVRDGVEVSGGFTANIDGELTVGGLDETVTVTGANPTVDVQSVRGVETIAREVYEVLPTARTYDALALLLPAMNIQGGPTTSLSIDTGGIGGKGNNALTLHGSNENDAVYDIDGLDSTRSGAIGAPETTPFDASIAEYVYEYSGNSADVETGGVRLNMIPKEGGNTFSGGFFADFSQSSWLANNVSQELIDFGLAGGKEGGVKLDQAWSVAPSLGGPIAEDRLWFFASYSFRRGSIFPANLFDSQDTSALVYVPDITSPTVDRQDMYEGSIRLTWQATSKDKVHALWNHQKLTQVPSLTGSQLDPVFIAPEAGSDRIGQPDTVLFSWVRPQTNRILFEAGFGTAPSISILDPLTGTKNARTDLPGVFEGTTLTMSRNMAFFFHGTELNFDRTNVTARASMSYVTGSHNLKIGMNAYRKSQTETYRSDNDWISMITVFGNPFNVRYSARPAETNQLMNVGIYVQDQWTVDRLTVNAGVRLDYFNGSYPDHVTEPMTWSPEPRSFSGATAAIWKDLQPRLGVAYDLRGDGRTALKVSASRYGDRNSVALAGRLNPVGNNISQTRSWFDGLNPFGIPGLPSCIGSVVCIAGDGLPQGDPLNPNPNGELLSPNTSLGFATPEITNFFDQDWAFGWGKKAANWEFSGSVQHELLDGVSVDVGYFRRSFINFSARDDGAVGPEDYDTYTLTVPADPRLPGGGDFPVTLVDLNPAAIRVPDTITTSADTFGGRSRTWQGIDVNFSARVAGGVLVQGGVATGTEASDSCSLQAALPETVEDGGPLEHCSTETPWISQVSVFGSYPLPYDIVLSAAFFSRQGPERSAVIQLSAADAAAALGRQPTLTSIAINVIEPGTVYGDRLNQLDFRVAKVIDFGGVSNLRASFDLFNVFNANAVSRERYGFVPGQADGYLTPTGLQPGRLVKVTFQLNF